MSISAISGSSTLHLNGLNSGAQTATASDSAGSQGAKGATLQLSAGKLGAKQSGGSSSSSKTYDKMDANKDGTVSAQEELVYELAHPAVTDAKSATAAGGDKAKTADKGTEKASGTTSVETYV